MRAGLLVLLVALSGCASQGELIVGTTTTLQDSGLLDALLPAFEADAGLRAKAVVGGTGEIHEKGKRGDVDVLLTHAPARERRLVEDGWATERRPVTFNRFAVAGPADDPAGVGAAAGAGDAMRRVHDGRHLFASRGDRSGTHEKELELWAAAGLDAAAFDSSWYKETGAGQGQTLLYASERGAYLLVDEGTLLQFHAQGKALATVDLFHGDAALRNQYAVLLLRGDDADARAFADWLTGPRGQAAVASFAADGAPLFTPNAGEEGA